MIDVVELVAIAAGYGCLISEVEDNRKEHFFKVYTAHIMTDCTVWGAIIEARQRTLPWASVLCVCSNRKSYCQA